MTEEISSEDLLTSFEPTIIRASTGKRLANYLIDLVVFYILIFGLGIVLAITSPNTVATYGGSDDLSMSLLDRLITLLFYGVYMSIVEAIFKGKSLGKLITGTRAVNLDGSTITTLTALKRGFSRAVPFCAFSAFGNPCDPWQDRWTDTLVMDEKESNLHGM